ncbi:hypothetical protein PENTCL1PPCAC_25078, partial [Pristionchus entomophagus]
HRPTSPNRPTSVLSVEHLGTASRTRLSSTSRAPHQGPDLQVACNRILGEGARTVRIGPGIGFGREEGRSRSFRGGVEAGLGIIRAGSDWGVG